MEVLCYSLASHDTLEELDFSYNGLGRLQRRTGGTGEKKLDVTEIQTR